MISNRSRLAQVLRATTPLVAVAFAAGVLVRFPPTQYSFYPQCPVYRLLHLQCPGCGTTRALAALLHGHIIEALRLNALTTVMLVPGFVYAAICYRRYIGTVPFRWPQIPSVSIYATLAAAILFMIFRNLPVHLL